MKKCNHEDTKVTKNSFRSEFLRVLRDFVVAFGYLNRILKSTRWLCSSVDCRVS